METKEVQKMDRYEYCYQLIEDIGETADEIEKVFRLSRKEALELKYKDETFTLATLSARIAPETTIIFDDNIESPFPAISIKEGA